LFISIYIANATSMTKAEGSEVSPREVIGRGAGKEEGM